MLSLSLVETRYLKGWANPIRIVSVVVVVDIAAAIDIPRIVGIARVRGASLYLKLPYIKHLKRC